MPAKSYYPQKRQGQAQPGNLGLIHVYYGDGVGKTTRSVGLAVRAAGAGLKVTFVQFMKSGDSSEVKAFAHLENLDYFCPGPHPMIGKKAPGPEHFDHARAALARAHEAANDQAQVLVCDEILNTLVFGLLTAEQVLELCDACQGRVELVMTGMDAPEAIRERADYVTRLVQEKHPYYQGWNARKGIEF